MNGAAMAEDTPAKHLEPFKWQKGVSANPSGRPKGARNKLGEAFIQALHDDFEANGIAAVERVRSEKPDQYLKVIASLLPKDVNLNLTDNLGELSDDELLGQIRDLAQRLAPFLGSAGDGAEAQGGAEIASRVH
jgi:hypothetical protein